jgi:hypothetical protein
LATPSVEVGAEWAAFYPRSGKQSRAGRRQFSKRSLWQPLLILPSQHIPQYITDARGRSASQLWHHLRQTILLSIARAGTLAAMHSDDPIGARAACKWEVLEVQNLMPDPETLLRSNKSALCSFTKATTGGYMSSSLALPLA